MTTLAHSKDIRLMLIMLRLWLRLRLRLSRSPQTWPELTRDGILGPGALQLASPPCLGWSWSWLPDRARQARACQSPEGRKQSPTSPPEEPGASRYAGPTAPSPHSPQPTQQAHTQAHKAHPGHCRSVSFGGLRLKPNPFLNQPDPLPPASSLLKLPLPFSLSST